MTIELTYRHATVFALLVVIQAAGLAITAARSPVLVLSPRGVWIGLFLMVPGSAFLTTIVIMELLRVVRR